VADGTLQLTIPLEARVLHRFENFHTGANGELVGLLKTLAEKGGALGLWLRGEAGSGRTHLLEASCQAAEQAGRRAIYVPLAELPASPGVLDALEADLIALDDVDAWLGELELEAALMALYQNQLQTHGQLLVCSTRTALQAEFVLPDLASRFRALPGYRLQAPDDQGLRDILFAAAHRQGLTLTDPVLDYWLHRAVRSLPELLAQLRMLDERALAEQRAVTIPLIKEVLAL
jgi:DnaA family protein